MEDTTQRWPLTSVYVSVKWALLSVATCSVGMTSDSFDCCFVGRWVHSSAAACGCDCENMHAAWSEQWAELSANKLPSDVSMHKHYCVRGLLTFPWQLDCTSVRRKNWGGDYAAKCQRRPVSAEEEKKMLVYFPPRDLAKLTTEQHVAEPAAHFSLWESSAAS